jgi:hypothetical protein
MRALIRIALTAAGYGRPRLTATSSERLRRCQSRLLQRALNACAAVTATSYERLKYSQLRRRYELQFPASLSPAAS